MSRKKANNKKKQQLHVKKFKSTQKDKANASVALDLPGLQHLSRPWQEFYRRVIEQIK